MLLFGGVINRDTESPYYDAVRKSSFGKAGYYPNNFNDLPSALICLFELLVINNWFVISDGFAAARGPPARLFFVTFYVVVVQLCLNVVVAFVMDTFFTTLD